MADWTPPPSGTPCWINIAVEDVQRAKRFYSAVFDWTFHPSGTQADKYPPDQIAFWNPPDRKSSPGGALSKADSLVFNKLKTKNIGTSGLYLYVEDLAPYIKKITEAGGKVASEVIPEGMGSMQHFEDTEGNHFGIYTVTPQGDK